MISRNTQVSPMLLPCTSSAEDIVQNMQGPKLCVTACDQAGHRQPQDAELSPQLDLGSDQLKDETEQPMEVSEEVPACSELHSLIVNYLNHIRAAPIKNAMLEDIKETVAKASELGFQAAYTRGNALCHSLEVALMDLNPKETMLSY